MAARHQKMHKKYFTVQEEVYNHKADSGETDRPFFHCEICNREFKTKQILNRHLRRHKFSNSLQIEELLLEVKKTKSGKSSADKFELMSESKPDRKHPQSVSVEVGHSLPLSNNLFSMDEEVSLSDTLMGQPNETIEQEKNSSETGKLSEELKNVITYSIAKRSDISHSETYQMSIPTEAGFKTTAIATEGEVTNVVKLTSIKQNKGTEKAEYNTMNSQYPKDGTTKLEEGNVDSQIWITRTGGYIQPQSEKLQTQLKSNVSTTGPIEYENAIAIPQNDMLESEEELVEPCKTDSENVLIKPTKIIKGPKENIGPESNYLHLETTTMKLLRGSVEQGHEAISHNTNYNIYSEQIQADLHCCNVVSKAVEYKQGMQVPFLIKRASEEYLLEPCKIRSDDQSVTIEPKKRIKGSKLQKKEPESNYLHFETTTRKSLQETLEQGDEDITGVSKNLDSEVTQLDSHCSVNKLVSGRECGEGVVSSNESEEVWSEASKLLTNQENVKTDINVIKGPKKENIEPESNYLHFETTTKVFRQTIGPEKNVPEKVRRLERVETEVDKVTSELVKKVVELEQENVELEMPLIKGNQQKIANCEIDTAEVQRREPSEIEGKDGLIGKESNEYCNITSQHGFAFEKQEFSECEDGITGIGKTSTNEIFPKSHIDMVIAKPEFEALEQESRKSSTRQDTTIKQKKTTPSYGSLEKIIEVVFEMENLELQENSILYRKESDTKDLRILDDLIQVFDSEKSFVVPENLTSDFLKECQALLLRSKALEMRSSGSTRGTKKLQFNDMAELDAEKFKLEHDFYALTKYAPKLHHNASELEKAASELEKVASELEKVASQLEKVATESEVEVTELAKANEKCKKKIVTRAMAETNNCRGARGLPENHVNQKDNATSSTKKTKGQVVKTGPVLYECDLCRRQFRYMHNVKRHKLVCCPALHKAKRKNYYTELMYDKSEVAKHSTPVTIATRNSVKIKSTRKENYKDGVGKKDDFTLSPKRGNIKAKNKNENNFTKKNKVDIKNNNKNVTKDANFDSKFMNKSSYPKKCTSYKKQTLKDLTSLYSCPKCDKSYNSKGSLSRHLKTPHRYKRSYKCDICEKEFYHKLHFDNHMNCHKDHKLHFDKHLIDKDKGELSIVKHKEKYKSNGCFTCEICSKKFKKRHLLKQHLFVHSCKTFKCEQCGNKFSQRQGLYQHHKKIHGDH